MREIVLTSSFKRSFRKFVRNNPELKQKIQDTIKEMRLDAFAPQLGTHKLSGKFMGLKACSCGYDCRIVFYIEQDRMSDEEIIVLIDVGKHDEVY